MKQISLIILVIGLGITAALAQDWRLGADGGSEYNCEIVNAIAEAHGDQPYLRRDGEIMTVAELLAEAAPACDAQPAIIHTANAVDGASLYQCAALSCDIVEQVTAEAILDVVAVDADWLTLQRGAQTLYLPISDVDKLSLEMLIRDTNPTFQVHADCFISPALGPGRELEFAVLIAGERYEKVAVELWRAGDDSALPIASRDAVIAAHTGSPAIELRYDPQLDLTPGQYIIELQAAGHSYKIAWEVTRAGPFRVNVGCE